MNTSRQGMTLIELLVVVTIIGILTRFGTPKYAEIRRQAVARAVTGDLNAIRLAAVSYNQDRNRWPANSGRGGTPAVLRSYLPSGFNFRRGSYDLDWDTYTVTTGRGRTRTTTTVPAVSVWSNDPKLRAAIAKMAKGGMAHVAYANRTMFLLLGHGA